MSQYLGTRTNDDLTARNEIFTVREQLSQLCYCRGIGNATRTLLGQIDWATDQQKLAAIREYEFMTTGGR